MSGNPNKLSTPNSAAPTRSTSRHRAILTPTSTPSETPHPTPDNPNSSLHLNLLLNSPKMEKDREEGKLEQAEPKQAETSSSTVTDPANVETDTSSPSQPKKHKAKARCEKNHKHKKKTKKSKKSSKHESSSSDSDSDDEEDLTTPTDSDEDSTDSEEDKRKRRKKQKAKAKRKADKKKKASKKHSKSKRAAVDSSSSEDASDSTDSESQSDSEDGKRRHRRSKKSTRVIEELSTTDEEDESLDEEEEEDEDDISAGAKLQLAALQKQMLLQRGSSRKTRGTAADTAAQSAELVDLLQRLLKKEKKRKSKKAKSKSKKKPKKASTLEYKRVDQLWDSTIHNYKLTESAEDKVDEFDEYVFCVRRTFDWENKYRSTVVDIKSPFLRDAVAEVMKDVKGVSLVEDQPSLDPNMLFLYLEEIRTYHKKTLKARLKREKKRKAQKRIKTTIAHCKVLVRYLDEDYDDTKKRLYPMLEAGNITFDLLWALFKPNSIAYTSTYGSWDDPRCFKVDYANKESSFIKGEWYCIEGRYLEYDGKSFGLGDFEMNIEQFQGARKITSLAGYPLKYHKDPEGVTKQLVDRGKRFVEHAGMNYRFHKGLAFQKKKKAVLRFNINGRIMIDPAIFRRINANYQVSVIKPKDQDDLFSDDDSDDCCGCGSDSDSDEWHRKPKAEDEEDVVKEPKVKWKLVKDEKDQFHIVEVPVDEEGREIKEQKLDKLHKGDGTEGSGGDRVFSEEELLIASPVVLGFAFSEKAWLEFTLSGVRDIEWNDEAFESLVLPEDRKSIVKALVSAHKFHAAETIDDVVQFKGRGLVFVLHGSPGVGKTLTAEGIAEYLKCPLYSVTAGELGTNSHVLEQELQKIMDIAHSWGAVLLLDEADVFLEKRQHQDVHRNAMVSIFLRLLEYFQGILFLTTNRVDTFDDAFQSRIHLPLRYEELSFKAKKEIWKMFLGKVRTMEAASSSIERSDTSQAPPSTDTTVATAGKNQDSAPAVPAAAPAPAAEPFTEADFSALSRVNLNGRQIKNCVRTAQAIAVNEGSTLCMEHIRRVLDVAESFDRDLRGGTGYLDAMRSYT